MSDALKYRCESCGFSLWHPLAELKASYLGLYNDARFPGRCLLVLKKHFDELESVPPEMASQFMLDIQQAGLAIANSVSANRMNYAILGNSVPHVHCHLIPRQSRQDPLPHRTPWETPLEKTELDQETLAEVGVRIRELLTKDEKEI